MLNLASFRRVGNGLGFTVYEVKPGLCLIAAEQPYQHLPVEYKLIDMVTGQEEYYYTADQVEKALSGTSVT